MSQTLDEWATEKAMGNLILQWDTHLYAFGINERREILRLLLISLREELHITGKWKFLGPSAKEKIR